MNTFVTQYAATRLALGVHDRRRRGQRGLIASLLLAFWQLLVIMLLLPIVLIQLLNQVHLDIRAAKADPDHRGTFFEGRRPPTTEEN